MEKRQNMKYSLYTICLIIALVVSSCGIGTTNLKEISCPEPKQECKPTAWAGTAVDTSKRYRDTASSYYEFLPLSNTNSINDEWAISFISEKKAIITSTEDSLQTPRIYRMPRFNSGTHESGIGGTDFANHFGMIAVRNKNAAFAAVNTNGFFNYGNSELYYSKFNENMIISPVSLSAEIDPKGFFWESQPTISTNGKVIFFSSDMLPNNGGTDIWFIAQMPDGKWSRAFNCGPVVNTACHELSPFISKDGRELYFSSCGHETVGGYDIFVSYISSDFWRAVAEGNTDALANPSNYFSRPENMRPPMNTASDELFPHIPDEDETTFYYSSNQQASSLIENKGGFDLFVRKLQVKVKFDDTKKEAPKDIPLAVDFEPALQETKLPDIDFPFFDFVGTVFNAATGKPVPKAELSVRMLTIGAQGKTIVGAIRMDTTNLETLENDRELENVARNNGNFFDKFDRNATPNTIYTADDNGNYKIPLEKGVQYEVTAQAPELFFESFKVSVAKDDTVKTQQHIYKVPESLTLRINFPYDEFSNPYKYALDTNGIPSNKTWQSELDLLAKNIKMSLDKIEKIILTGHTDIIASEQYNLNLGRKRVAFIAKQLINRGVPAEILEERSAGKSQLLDQKPGESDEQWHLRCRRVELEKILKK